jgi:hypothetical protein
MNLPGSLPERVYLLTYDRDRERFTGRTWSGYLLRAAALAELGARGLLEDRGGKVVANTAKPLNDSLLGPVLAEISEGKPHSWQGLIRRNRGALEDATVAALESAGFVTVERPGTRWRRRKLSIRDPRVMSRLSERVRVIISGPTPAARVDETDAALVAILAAGSVRAAITKSQAREYAGRISDLTARSGPIAPALRRALQAAKSSGS